MRRFAAIISVAILSSVLFLQLCFVLYKEVTNNDASLIVQYNQDGKPINCWRVPHRVSGGGNHLTWKTDDGWVQVSAPFTSLPVAPNHWETAAQELGIDLTKCTGGRYQTD